ncbi:MAG: hypothetical protein K8I02_10325, partial [Candidatus Methylomirabilis sp.]|nr:hypothetical protein [Deltaproteobacteria bacterium]
MTQQVQAGPTVAEKCYRIADAVAENDGFAENAIKVLEKRYFKKDDEGRPLEDPSDLMRRVARCLAAPDLRWSSPDEVRRLEDDFYDMLMAREFIPNSPTLMNAGRPLGQLSACFVLPVPDSLDRIFDTIKHAALIHKSGGGTGFAFSRLRPKNDIVASTKGVSS